MLNVLISVKILVPENVCRRSFSGIQALATLFQASLLAVMTQNLCKQ